MVLERNCPEQVLRTLPLQLQFWLSVFGVTMLISVGITFWLNPTMVTVVLAQHLFGIGLMLPLAQVGVRQNELFLFVLAYFCALVLIGLPGTISYMLSIEHPFIVTETWLGGNHTPQQYLAHGLALWASTLVALPTLLTSRSYFKQARTKLLP